MAERADIAALEYRHHAVEVTRFDDTEPSMSCGSCGGRWPCEVGQLIAELKSTSANAESLFRQGIEHFNRAVRAEAHLAELRAEVEACDCGALPAMHRSGCAAMAEGTTQD